MVPEKRWRGRRHKRFVARAAQFGSPVRLLLTNYLSLLLTLSHPCGPCAKALRLIVLHGSRRSFHILDCLLSSQIVSENTRQRMLFVPGEERRTFIETRYILVVLPTSFKCKLLLRAAPTDGIHYRFRFALHGAFTGAGMRVVAYRTCYL